MTDVANENIDRYAVFGNPIAHSKSPLIHSLFAEQTAQKISYTAVLVLPDKFNEAVSTFAKSGGKGINITVPFKIDAWNLATHLSERAKRAGAVNTLTINQDGDYSADNTDGVGLIRDLTTNNMIDICGKSILIIGAGGAVRGTLQPLLEQQPKEIIIANRTKQTAINLAQDFSDLGNIQGIGLDELDTITTDIIINGTSASLHGELPPLPNSLVGSSTFCYDMMYADEPTVFMQWGSDNGAAKVSDGLGMLVEQAAESFSIWRSVQPETKTVIQTIRNSLKK